MLLWLFVLHWLSLHELAINVADVSNTIATMLRSTDLSAF